jgi:acetyl esterase/lipase
MNPKSHRAGEDNSSTPKADGKTGSSSDQAAPRLDPYYQPWVERLADLPADAYVSSDPDVRSRIMELVDAGQSVVHAQVPTKEQILDGPHGPFRVRLYMPPGGNGPWPALLWMHGGGFAGGDLDMPEGDGVSREVCARTPAVVVSVDYHLASKTVYWPVPHDDCMAALHWVVEHSGELRIDPARICVGGARAGANLAAGVTLRARDEGGPRIRSLLLVYPALYLDPPPHPPQLREALRRLPPVFGGGDVDLARDRGISIFLGPTIHQPSPYAVPALADVAGLPPTLVVLSEYDGLRPGGEAFVEKLRSADVPVTEHMEPGVLHGHLNLVGQLPGAGHTIDVMARLLAEENA